MPGENVFASLDRDEVDRLALNHGFRRLGSRTWSRHKGDFVQLVNLQRSQWAKDVTYLNFRFGRLCWASRQVSPRASSCFGHAANTCPYRISPASSRRLACGTGGGTQDEARFGWGEEGIGASVALSAAERGGLRRARLVLGNLEGLVPATPLRHRMIGPARADRRQFLTQHYLLRLSKECWPA
jgi:hypothetical protein